MLQGLNDGLCPEAEKIVDTCVFMPLNEWFTDKDVDEVATGIGRVADYFARKA